MQGSSFLLLDEKAFSHFSLEKSSKRASPPHAPPHGGDVTAPPRRSYIMVCSPHQRGGMIIISPPQPLPYGRENNHFAPLGERQVRGS